MSYTELTTKRVQGRKNYRCEWCPEKIEIREIHIYRSYMFESEFRTGRMHIECFAAMESSCESVSDGWTESEYKRGEVV